MLIIVFCNLYLSLLLYFMFINFHTRNRRIFLVAKGCWFRIADKFSERASLCLEVLNVRGNELRLFWARPFPLLYLMMMRTWHISLWDYFNGRDSSEWIKYDTGLNAHYARLPSFFIKLSYFVVQRDKVSDLKPNYSSMAFRSIRTGSQPDWKIMYSIKLYHKISISFVSPCLRLLVADKTGFNLIIFHLISADSCLNIYSCISVVGLLYSTKSVCLSTYKYVFPRT